eukprot:117560-Amphidinium_carterae.1
MHYQRVSKCGPLLQTLRWMSSGGAVSVSTDVLAEDTVADCGRNQCTRGLDGRSLEGKPTCRHRSETRSASTQLYTPVAQNGAVQRGQTHLHELAY